MTVDNYAKMLNDMASANIHKAVFPLAPDYLSVIMVNITNAASQGRFALNIHLPMEFGECKNVVVTALKQLGLEVVAFEESEEIRLHVSWGDHTLQS